mmetsp:Transcript_20124/g.47352  ORF Transcript_20124/g.47352 Transcript_20124/m.47352 type:complete len:627 (-) Transcript_20124:208-2088(-)
MPIPALPMPTPSAAEVHPSAASAAATAVYQISESFQRVVDQIVQQHLIELAEVDEHSQHKRRPSLEKDASKASKITKDTDESVRSQKLERLNSLETNRESSGNNLAKKFKERCLETRRQPHEVQANQVLNALAHRDTPPEKFFNSPSPSIGGVFGTHQTLFELDLDGAATPQMLRDAITEESSGITMRMTSESIRSWLGSHKFDLVLTALLCLNVIWMSLELQVSGSYTGFRLNVNAYTLLPAEWEESATRFFQTGDLIFTSLYTLDVIVRIIALRRQFWHQCMNYLDVLVTLVSIIEVIMVTPVNPFLFRLLRIGKLARALRLITLSNVLQSLELLTKCLQASVEMLFWTFCLLICIQCVAGMLVSGLCRDYIEDETNNPQIREQVFRYYGTFSRTLLSMFEILFANWGPPCRVVVENISEWFSVFFLLYRCVLGFAVLNVVSAVFVQQTMKTASSDEELAFKQKERDVAMYTRKVRKLFQTMDDSGDGSLNLEEFAKLANSPKLKFWMSQLELEYHDLLSLFEFLDNGDGEITLMEFIEGAARLRGGAKALDIWRIETKLEVLFEEVLKALHHSSGKIMPLSVQEVFQKSTFRHIKTTKIDAEEREDETDKAENSRVSKVSNVL